MSYTPSLVSCYEDDTCTASSCYIPTVFLDNLKTACNNLGLTLFKVTDVSSTFLPIFDTSRGQLFIHSNGLITAMNEFGSMSWLLPEAVPSPPKPKMLTDICQNQPSLHIQAPDILLISCFSVLSVSKLYRC